jgi:D-glycero-D-manno-heptose 1,7-bisphosphate phosphatase
LLSEDGVRVLHEYLQLQLLDAGAPQLDGWYFCPHHPKATLTSYRLDCECRKPQPGLLLRAAQELGLELTASFAVGDRITDIIAGWRARCRTILVQTGKHLEPPIETREPLDQTIQPDYVCADLQAAADWISRTT